MAGDRWHEVERLFHEALTKSEAERLAYIDAITAGDPFLKQEVLSLLAEDRNASEFLEGPALHVAASQLVADGYSPKPPTVRGYTIIRELGEGGMGVVYLAQQDAPISRYVALKLIRPGMDSRRVVARFDLERQALALMQHPGIAAVYDAGTAEDGRPYFAMEYVDGVPITAFASERRLTVRERLALVAGLCEAVQHAHQKGVIHRDLKPSNVLVREDNGRFVAKVIDFGIARATGATRSVSGGVTEHDQRVGTLEYMSPEQADPGGVDVDTRSDIYALGVLLYELLSGSLPAVASTAGEEPVRPSTIRHGIEPDLDWIVLKAIARDRARRYASASELAADIEHHLRDEPVVARPPSAFYRIQKFINRHRAAVLATVALFVVLIAGLITSGTLYVGMARQRDEAHRQTIGANEARRAADLASNDAKSQARALATAKDVLARQNQQLALAAAAERNARSDAEYRAYLATIAAADGELRLGLTQIARTRLNAVPLDLRQWEWQHLFLKTDESSETLTTGDRCGVAWINRLKGPFDNLIRIQRTTGEIVFKQCGTLDLWSVATLSHRSIKMPGSNTLIPRIDNMILALGDAGQAVVNVGNGAEQTRWAAAIVDIASLHFGTLFGPLSRAPICAELSADGTRLAIGLRPVVTIGQSGLELLGDEFELWDTRLVRRITTVRPARPTLRDTRFVTPEPRCHLAFSADGSLLASSGGTVHIWSTETGAEVMADAVQAGNVAQPIAFTPNGEQLAVGRPTGLIDLIDPARAVTTHLSTNGLIHESPLFESDRRQLGLFRGQTEVQAIAFSPNGLQLASASDRQIQLWDLTTMAISQTLAGHSSTIVGLSFGAHGDWLYSGDMDGSVRTWYLPTAGAVRTVPGSFEFGAQIAPNSDGAAVGTMRLDGTISLWHFDPIAEVRLQPGSGHLSPAGQLAVAPDGQSVITAVADAVRVIDVGTLGSAQIQLTKLGDSDCDSPPRYRLPRMKLSADGRLLAYQLARCLIVEDVLQRRALGKYPFRLVPLAFAFLPDGRLFLIENSAEALQLHARVWDWHADRTVSSTIVAGVGIGPTTSVAVSRDGLWVAIRGDDPAVVSIWDAALTHERTRLPRTDATRDMAFNTDGSRLATSGTDNLVRIWDTRTGQLLLILTDSAPHIGGIVFTDAGRIIAGRNGGGLTIWESKPPVTTIQRR